MWQNGACYIRVSTDDQTEFSPDAQLKAIKSYAKKNNITLVKNHIYIDEGISGKKAEKRPAFMEMIATAKTKPKPFDVILVHKFDRFARSREDSVVYKSLLKKEAGIKVVSITETIEDDKFSVILEAMLEAMAEYYSLNLAEEVKKGMTEKAIRGGLQTGAPFGYRVVDNILTVVPEEANFVKFIFEKYTNKERNMLQLARYLNEMGVRTHQGNLFENRAIDYIIHNPVYIGKLRWTPTKRVRRNFNDPDTIIADAEHEAIINIELWEKAQKISRDVKEVYHKNYTPNKSIVRWSTGLIKCSKCGRSLVKNNQVYYQCNGYAKGTCPATQSIKIEVAENLILEQLKKDFQDNLEIKIVPKISDIKNVNEYELLQERLIKLEQKERRIKEAYQDGIDTKEEYKENKEKLDIEKAFINSEIGKLDSNLRCEDSGDDNIVKRIKNTYTLLTDETIEMEVKYQTAHFLINKVVYDKQEKTLSIEYK